MKKIIITGNVGKDPELRADPNGETFTTFSLAVSVGTKQNPKTDWVSVSCKGKLAETVNTYVKKGNKLLIEGFPSVNAYINKEQRAVGSLVVYANNIEFVGSKDEAKKDNSPYVLPNTDNVSDEASLTSDDIPF